MNNRQEMQAKLLEKIEAHYLKVKADYEKNNTPARMAKMNVLCRMKDYLSDTPGYDLKTLQMVVKANAQYDKNTSFFMSDTESLLHEVIKFKSGEEAEQQFEFKCR